MLIAFAILVVMYYGMIFSIGEMAAAMPHTGGAYSFARSAMGPWGGLVTGAAETIEYVATTAVIVYFSASYADAITSELLNFSMPTWVWWIILYVVFIALNSAGAAISFKFAIVVSIISIGIILVFSAMAIFSGAFQWANLWTSPRSRSDRVPAARRAPDPVRAALRDVVLPRHRGAAARGGGGSQPVRDIPKAGFWARGTLIVTGLLVLFLNTGVIGAEATGVAAEPLWTASARSAARARDRSATSSPRSRAVRARRPPRVPPGHHVRVRAQHVLALPRRYTRVSSPSPESARLPVRPHDRRRDRLHRPGGARHVAALNEGAGAVAGAIVLNIAVWGAVLAYLLQMISFVILRRKFPDAHRPYRSPWGIAGAVIAAAIAALIFVGFLLNPTFVPAIIAIFIVYVIILLGFALFFRHRLVLSPRRSTPCPAGSTGTLRKRATTPWRPRCFGDEAKK